MTRWMVASSLRLGRLVIAVSLALLVAGVVQLRNAPVDTYPQFTPPSVQIQTEALGLSATEVEQFITVPLEQDLLNGVPWLDTITSQSEPGLSAIDLVFQRGTNLYRARQAVQERLSQAHALPNVGSSPIMVQPLSSTGRVMMVGLSSRNVSLVELSVLARWKIRPRLMGVPGVANVSIWGQRDRQLQIQVDPDRLRKYGVTLNEVIDSTGNALWVSPLTFVEASTPGTGGFLDTANQRFAVQHILPITTPKTMASVTLENKDGQTLRLGDVATVTQNHQPLIGDAVLDGGPSLMLVIQKYPGVNTREVTKALDDALAAMRPGLSGITVDSNVYRPANFVDSALHNLGRASVVGLLLALVALGLLLFSWRVAVIGLVALPLSLVAAAYVLYLRGTTLTLMTAAGLAVAVAVVVDDIVVATSSIRARLRGPQDEEASKQSALVEALAQTGRPLGFALLILGLAVAPVYLLPGVAGSFAKPVIVSYLLAVLVSLVVAAVVTPALAVVVFTDASAANRLGPPALWIQQAVTRGLRRFLGRPGVLFATGGALALGVMAVVPQIGSHQVLPAPHDRDVVVQWQAIPGTSLPEMDRITTAASGEIRGLHGVKEVGVHVGRAVTSDQLVNVNSAETWVKLDGKADYGATITAIRRVVDGYPGLRHDVVTYPQEQVAQAESGLRDPVVVRLYGIDLDTLAAKAEQVRQMLARVPGVRNAKVATVAEEPTLQVQVDLAAAQRYGIKPGDVRRAASTLLSGIQVGNLYENAAVFDVVVWGTPAIRHDPLSLQKLLLDTPSGSHVRLGDVATVQIKPTPVAIRHDATSRSIDITAAVHGRSLAAVIHDVRARIAGTAMPLEYHAEVLSDTLHQQADLRRTVVYCCVAVLGIFLLLQALFTSWRLASVLLPTLPLGVAGGVVVAPLVGGVMSLGASLGLLAVFGLVARNGILLVSDWERSRAAGQEVSADAVIRDAASRAVPVVATAVTVAALVLPFAVSGNIAGLEELHPLAVTVLGGLVSSTVVALFVLPGLYLRFGRSQRGPLPRGWLRGLTGAHHLHRQPRGGGRHVAP